MAWLILGIIVWGVLMLLVTPLLKKSLPDMGHQTEIAAYKSEIDRLTSEIEQTNDAQLKDRKIGLQRQLLELTKSEKQAHAPSLLIINSLFAFFVFGAIGLYALLGSPELTQKDALKYSADIQQPAYSAQNAEPQESVETLLVQLKEKLDTTESQDPNGWLIYARTLMNTGRFEEAFEAYDRVLALTENKDSIVEELKSARAFADRTQNAPEQNAAPGPTAEDMKAAASMSTEDRAAMIENMVSGLAARLEADPNNPEGWVRLLTARRVLGQSDLAKVDIAMIRTTFSGTPETVEAILSKSGWNSETPE